MVARATWRCPDKRSSAAAKAHPSTIISAEGRRFLWAGIVRRLTMLSGPRLDVNARSAQARAVTSIDVPGLPKRGCAIPLLGIGEKKRCVGLCGRSLPEQPHSIQFPQASCVRCSLGATRDSSSPRLCLPASFGVSQTLSNDNSKPPRRIGRGVALRSFRMSA